MFHDSTETRRLILLFTFPDRFATLSSCTEFRCAIKMSASKWVCMGFEGSQTTVRIGIVVKAAVSTVTATFSLCIEVEDK